MWNSPLLPRLFASPKVPRFRQSQAATRSPSQISPMDGSRPQSNLQSINVEWETVVQDRSERKPGQKQNLMPHIFQQKKLEMLQKPRQVPMRRPSTSHEIGSHEPLHPLLPNGATIHTSEFNIDDFLIDSYCAKMSRSIILAEPSPEAIVDVKPKSKEPQLSASCFHRIRRLGSGKYGEVFLAIHKISGLICAMKVIDKGVIREENMEQQIAREIRIHSTLRNLNIVEFYGFFDDADKFYILLEYATDGSVFSRLKGRTRLEEHVIQPIARGLCDGLKFMHRMGYVHRDIKPENIVLQFGVPKICDFGWATTCSGNTCKSYCGTPLYISPEMIRKEKYGTSVDLWAMGLVVYELLVGRGPFRIWSEQDMKEVLYKSIEFPEYVDRSADCEDFILSCLDKNPMDRIEIESAQRHKFLQTKPFVELEYDFFEQAKQCLGSAAPMRL